MAKALNIGSGLLLSNSVDVGVGIGTMRQENGVPVYRYKKEVIRSGKYFKDADKLAFTVTKEVLDHWALTFSKWKKGGNKVAVPETHDGAQDPSKNRGWVVEMFREGDSLFAIMDLYGADSPKVAATNDVSIYSPVEVTDGAGNVYARPITHIALCMDPVIPGLSKFEAIAASRKPLKQEYQMDSKKLAGLLGLSLDEKDTDEEKDKKIEASIKSLKASKAVKASAEGEDLTEEEKKKLAEEKAKAVAASMEEDEEKEKKAVAASRSAVNPMMLSLASENREMKLSRLVTAGKITPAVCEKLKTKYVDKDALTLSLARGGDDFDSVVSMFAENDPVALREQSGPQLLQLGDLLKTGGKNPLLADAEGRTKK